MPSVMIIDDHAGFVDAARKLLSTEGFDVVGDAPDGQSGVALVEQMHPDVVLLDIQLPDIDGFEVARRLVDITPSPAVVLTSSRDALDYGSRVGAAPARGFIGKAELTGKRLAALVGLALS
jgi:DNA-binding NarL/FixJ family response regulator